MTIMLIDIFFYLAVVILIAFEAGLDFSLKSEEVEKGDNYTRKMENDQLL